MYPTLLLRHSSFCTRQLSKVQEAFKFTTTLDVLCSFFQFKDLRTSNPICSEYTEQN